MNISELPLDKLKLCIENEKNRLEHINYSLHRKYQEYDKKRAEFRNMLSDMEDEISELEIAKVGAKDFLDECEIRLKELGL